MRQALRLPFRHFLIWCLALLLPLQGLSASAGLHCVAMATAGPAPMAMGDGEHPCHAIAAADAAQAHHLASAASTEPGVATAASDTTATGHTCSACAVCCPAAALPSHSHWAATLGVAQALPALRLPGRAAVASAGLDRPPKTFIA